MYFVLLALSVCLLCACTQVIPALDPSTPIYAGAFVMELVQRRAMEFSLHDPNR